MAAAAAQAPAAGPKKKKWFWQKDPIPEANPEEKIKPAPVRKNQPVRRVLGDDAAVLAPSSGEEPAPPRYRAGVASMA